MHFCEEHDVKIELILETCDVPTANGEMIFGMNFSIWATRKKRNWSKNKKSYGRNGFRAYTP